VDPGRARAISISERTKAGLARAKRAGKALGRKPYAVDMKAVRAKQRLVRVCGESLGSWYQSRSVGKASQGEVTGVQIGNPVK
jgi:hypothetical protein